MEFGRWMDAPTAYERDAEFELRRIASQVVFSINEQRVYVSPNLSTGPVLVGGALYRAQDRVL
jgi:hypothetical protein